MRLFKFLDALKNPPRIIAFPLIAITATIFAKASAIIMLILIVLYAVGVVSGYWVVGAFIFCIANVIIGGVFAMLTTKELGK